MGSGLTEFAAPPPEAVMVQFRLLEIALENKSLVELYWSNSRSLTVIGVLHVESLKTVGQPDPAVTANEVEVLRGD